MGNPVTWNSMSLSGSGGWQACRMRQMCCVSSRETSSKSPSIMSCSSCSMAVDDSSSTGASTWRGTSGDLRTFRRGDAPEERTQNKNKMIRTIVRGMNE